MSKFEYQQLFLFAAKAGALEGYLFNRKEVEPLTGWVDNISQMYRDLPSAVKTEVAPVFTPVLERILAHGARVLGPDIREKVERLLLAASASSKTEKED